MPTPSSSSASSASRSTERWQCPGRPSSGFSHSRARAGEERVDEVAQVEARLAHELAEGAGAAEPAEAGGGKALTPAIFAFRAVPPPRRQRASPTSQAPPWRGFDHGSLS